MTLKNTDMAMPLYDIFPESWAKNIGKCHFLPFRNLDHFKSEVGKIKQNSDNMCEMSYAAALEMLIKGETDFPEEEQESIRNLVRSNLMKRGLITEEVYEDYRYTTDGTQVDIDVGKYVSGEPDCVITPSQQYIDFFYELYVSISYPYNVQNSTVRENVAKLLATVEELERRHIFIKVTLILPIRDAVLDNTHNFFSSIPLFSHKDQKSVSVMSSVINERLLRKFYFAILETVFKEKLAGGYGSPVSLDNAMNIGSQFDEIEFYENVVNKVGA
jgi:hypothetical protein